MEATKRNLKGFTLIEVLVVIALIAVLAAITIIAINPQQNFQDARNTTRSSDATQILNAITQYTAQQGTTVGDFGGGAGLPDCTSPGPVEIGTATGNLDLTAELVPTFIVGIPVDPQGTGDTATGYEVCTTSGGRVRVDAPLAEGTTISVER